MDCSNGDYLCSGCCDNCDCGDCGDCLCFCESVQEEAESEGYKGLLCLLHYCFTLHKLDLCFYHDLFFPDLQFDCMHPLNSTKQSKDETPVGVLSIGW